MMFCGNWWSIRRRGNIFYPRLGGVQGDVINCDASKNTSRGITHNNMIVTIQKATQLTGKSRSTIERYIKNGMLSRSVDGIDTSELLRVFGAFVQSGDAVHDASTDTAVTQREAWLMQQIEDLKHQHKEYKNESLKREEWLRSEMQNLNLLLLTHQKNQVTVTPTNNSVKKTNLFKKIFKKDLR
jgi:hypothetical protein